MIVREQIEGRDLIKTYSDAGFMIRQEPTGAIYGEAIDVEDAPYTYVETDIPIDAPEEPEDREEIEIPH